MRTASDGSAYTENNSWRIAAAAKKVLNQLLLRQLTEYPKILHLPVGIAKDSEADDTGSRQLSGVYPSAEECQSWHSPTFPVQDAAISAI